MSITQQFDSLHMGTLRDHYRSGEGGTGCCPRYGHSSHDGGGGVGEVFLECLGYYRACGQLKGN